MGRPKGSKNKAKLKEMDEIVSKSSAPVYYETTPTGEIEVSEIKETKHNPLKGYTLDEIRGFIDEIDPPCARGGCLHRKHKHYVGNSKPTECHAGGCNCTEFLS